MKKMVTNKKIIERFKQLEDWQKKKLLFWFLTIFILGLGYLAITGSMLYKDRIAEDGYWESGLKDNEEVANKIGEYSTNATEVTVGTYVENLKEVSIKSSSFRVVANCWFKWEGDKELDMINNFRVYNGTVNKKEILIDETEGNTHYQLARIDVTIAKNYWIVRFPLESYQLRFFIEPTYPVDQVILKADMENSTVNSAMTLSGFKLERNAVSIYSMEYDNNHSDPEKAVPITQELCTSLEINRTSIGLYVKCFVALFGTLTWVFVTIYLCTFHKIDPLSMIPACLFGTVTNIMVGANLLPDSLQFGLLEYANIAGILVVLSGATCVININRIRSKYQDAEFAFLFGRVMLLTLLTLTAAGIFVFPLCAYRF